MFKQISKFPVVERDLAIAVDKTVAWGDMVDVIKNSAGEYLEDVKLFDIYTGDQIAEGKKSMAFNLTFVSVDRTLNLEEIDQTIQNILKALNEKLGAELR